MSEVTICCGKLKNCRLESMTSFGRYEICLKNEANDKMGYIVFGFDEEERFVWIYKIKTNERFQKRLGVGNVLICAMEKWRLKTDTGKLQEHIIL